MQLGNNFLPVYQGMQLGGFFCLIQGKRKKLSLLWVGYNLPQPKHSQTQMEVGIL